MEQRNLGVRKNLAGRKRTHKTLVWECLAIPRASKAQIAEKHGFPPPQAAIIQLQEEIS